MIPDTLIENNRLNKTSGVIKAFQTLMSASRGEVTCVVTTAKVRRTILLEYAHHAMTTILLCMQPAGDKITKDLEKVLQKFLEKNQVLKLEVKVSTRVYFATASVQ